MGVSIGIELCRSSKVRGPFCGWRGCRELLGKSERAPLVRGALPVEAMKLDYIWTLSCQELADLRAALTLLMFSTPVVLSQSSKALTPCLAKMGTTVDDYQIFRKRAEPL